MLDEKEYEHILKCMETLKHIPIRSQKWKDKFLWLRDRVQTAFRVGSISVTQYQTLDKRLSHIDDIVKKKLSIKNE